MSPMGSRKRVKPSAPGADPQPAQSSNDAPAAVSSEEQPASVNQGNGPSWYPGAWPAISRVAKAAPVTEVARESVSVAKNLASRNTSSQSLAAPDPQKHGRNPSLQLTKKGGSSSRSLPADATTTRVNIGSDGSSSTLGIDLASKPTISETDKVAERRVDVKESDTVDSGSKEQPQAADGTPTSDGNTESAKPSDTPPTLNQTGGWFSWLYRSSTPATQDSAPAEARTEQSSNGQTLNKTETDPGSKEPADKINTDQQQNPAETTEPQRTSQKRSWFQMWYGASSSSKGGDESQQESSTQPDEHAPDDYQKKTASDNEFNKPGEVGTVSKVTGENAKASGWSFWFKDGSKDDAQPHAQSQYQDEASATGPPRDQGHLERKPEPPVKVEPARKESIKVKPPKDSTKVDKVTHEAEPNVAPSTPKASEATASKQLQKVLPNQLLPRFTDTFALEETPSWWQTIGRFLHYSREPDYKHVYMIKDPPHIKKALAIGIHGYFPAPLIRSVLGQPTGTSIKFTNMAADAIRKWTEEHGYSCDIEKLALEGEGRISERLDLLWKLLLNSMDDIRKADFIMIACHSQGVPVAIMLVAKLISFGCLNATRVGVCAMAGVNQGPFNDYRSRWISGSAGELFEFALPHSHVSQTYEEALRTAVNFGVRISYIGSIDDQLVSLESSIFSPINHPYIYRAVFVDGRVHAPSFLSHLVGFALKLRNLGISDHGLIRELSSPLAGSLYTGEGHSRLYDEEAVYYLAVEFAIQTSNVSGASLQVRRPGVAPAANPYILPFAMRGLLEEEYVRRELYEETMELLKQFDDWKPSSRVLKDVKFRLEGIRSKL